MVGMNEDSPLLLLWQPKLPESVIGICAILESMPLAHQVAMSTQGPIGRPPRPARISVSIGSALELLRRSESRQTQRLLLTRCSRRNQPVQ